MRALTPARRRGRRTAAIVALILGAAMVAAGASPAPAMAQTDHRIHVRAPAPGHTADARFCASPEGYARTAVLTVPAAAGPALAPEHGLRFTLRDDRGAVLAEALTADELRSTRLDLGRFGDDESVCVTLVAHTPSSADDSFRTATAEVALRVGSEGLIPGGVLAATGMNAQFTILVVATGVVLILVAGLLLVAGRRRRPGRLVCVAAGLCGVALVGTLAAQSWATFTDRSAVDVAASGQFGIAIRDADGKARQSGDRSVTYAYSDSGDLVPGNTAVLTLAVFNNSVSADGRFTLRITGAGALAPFVRYSISMDAGGTGTVLAGTPDTPATGAAMVGDALRADLGTVSASGVRLADGDALPASAAGSVRTLTVKVHLLDDAALRSLTGGSFELAIDVIGETL